MADKVKPVTGMEIYNALAKVPAEATRKITGGRLNGFTDINPMWRIQKLTETFGPCGIGWYTEIVDRWTTEGNGEISAHVRIKLYYRVDSSSWSAPVEGVGGSKVVSKENKGAYHSDEAFKMAYTDAISVACKALGMAADIYFAKGVKTRENATKYDDPPTPEPTPASGKQQQYLDRAAEEQRPTNIDHETYWKVVDAYARGRLTKSGEDYRTVLIRKYNLTAGQITRFDLDVTNYKNANSLD
ncbi:MAG: hypothetical protein IJ654_10540 [Bacteroidales bacterium]|nr:hypothetical protein [Bacteroidales bacterium]